MANYLDRVAPRSKTKSILLPTIAIGGGLAAFGALWYFLRLAGKTVAAVVQAVATGGSVAVHTTGYWPYTAREDEKKMEGGTSDRKGKPLHTLEMHLADPVAHPFVSVSGDPTIWPYGQRISISYWPKAIFRVVDTGSHFTGIKKVYRVRGEEPLDICVNDSKTVVPKSNVVATIFPGDNFEGGKAVATSKFKDQTVAGEDDFTADDREALARAIESNLGGRPKEEQVAAAWAIRNRADNLRMSLNQLLAPRGEYGSPAKSGGFASTRKAPTDNVIAVVTEVLAIPASNDPTDGATDFWVPSQQTELRRLGDVYRAAKRSGDAGKAKKYERYAGYGSEGDVRVQQVRDGLRVVDVVGAVELLRKVV